MTRSSLSPEVIARFTVEADWDAEYGALVLAVARVDDRRIEVMIRETYQAPENARKSSFPIARGTRREDFRPYAKESLLASRGAAAEA